MKFKISLILFLMVGVLLAQVPTMWNNETAIRQGVNIEWFRTATNTNDGAVVYVWSDTKLGERDVWAQKLDSSGTHLWGEPILVDGKASRQEDPVVIGTTDGGVIIAWVDFSNEDSGDIYAQKINSNGEKEWADGGVALCTAPEIQISLNIVRDDDGGAYVIWMDMRNAGGSDIYGVHLDSDGNNLWDVNGNAIASGDGDQYSHTFWEDGQGGAIMAYVTRVASNVDLEITRILSDGTQPWGDGALVLCDANGDQGPVKITPDGANSFALAWADERTDDGDIYGRRIDIDGNFLTDEFAIYAGTSKQIGPRVTSNGDETFFVIWDDDRLTNDDSDIFIQRIDSAGNPLWAPEGVIICDEDYHQKNARIVPDLEEGCYIVWDDQRPGGHPQVDIYLQHLDADGNNTFTEDGLLICDSPNWQVKPSIKFNDGKVFLVWEDGRNGSIGLYSQIVDPSGTMIQDINGEIVFWGLSGDASDIQIVENNQNAIIVWKDNRFAAEGNKIFCQILDENGNISFEENGIQITESLPGEQAYSKIIPNNQNGATIVWTQADAEANKAYAQSIDSSGNKLFGENGLALCSLAENQEDVNISSENGSFYTGWRIMNSASWPPTYYICGQKIVDGNPQWTDEGKTIATAEGQDLFMEDIVGRYYIYSSGPFEETDTDIYVKLVDENGDTAPNWPENGVPICQAEEGQKNPKGFMTSQGLLIIWQDSRMGSADIYAQIINEDASVEWDINGIPFADYNADQSQANVLIDSDIYAYWTDFRNGNNEDIAMQKFNYEPTNLWSDDAVFITEKDSAQVLPSAVSFDEHKLVVWEDYYTKDSDVYAAVVTNDGEVLGPDNGFEVCTEYSFQHEPKLAKLDDSNTYVVWQDGRSSGKELIYGIYAQKLSVQEIVHNDENGIEVSQPVSLNQNYPNPFNPNTEISFNIMNDENVVLSIYNVKGQQVKTLVTDDLKAGNHKYLWNGQNDSGENVSSGMYFYKLDTSKKSITKKMLLMK